MKAHTPAAGLGTARSNLQRCRWEARGVQPPKSSGFTTAEGRLALFPSQPSFLPWPLTRAATSSYRPGTWGARLSQAQLFLLLAVPFTRTIATVSSLAWVPSVRPASAQKQCLLQTDVFSYNNPGTQDADRDQVLFPSHRGLCAGRVPRLPPRGHNAAAVAPGFGSVGGKAVSSSL